MRGSRADPQPIASHLLERPRFAHAGRISIVNVGALALLAIPAVGLADHGHHHGTSDPAGTVKSFDQETGVLTIDLAKGGDIEGLVTNDTRVRCNDNSGREGRRHNRRHDRRATASDSGPGHDGSGGDDNSGSGNGENNAEEPGEDNHNEGNEPGEDNHGEEGNEPGEDNHDEQGENNEEHGHANGQCVPQLVAGATVRRAELELENGVATFDKVVLMPAPEEMQEAPPAG